MSLETIAGQVLSAVFAAAEAPAPATGQPASDPFSILWFMAPMLLVMWFFMLRPNQKREKERQAMLAGISKGDKVIMASGIIGNVVGVTDKTVVLRVSEEPPVKMEFLRGSVSRVVKDEKESK
mgnify:CR=1 FL=1